MEFTLDRFRTAHKSSYEMALWEIRDGRKESHWIWYIFPQLQGLGYSAMAQYYEIQNREEAVAYWKDPVLSGHLVEISRALLRLDDSIDDILGYPDNLKVKSCMTLFYLVTGEEIFKMVLDKFYNGELDEYTRQKLTEKA